MLSVNTPIYKKIDFLSLPINWGTTIQESWKRTVLLSAAYKSPSEPPVSPAKRHSSHLILSSGLTFGDRAVTGDSKMPRFLRTGALLVLGLFAISRAEGEAESKVGNRREHFVGVSDIDPILLYRDHCSRLSLIRKMRHQASIKPLLQRGRFSQMTSKTV